MTTCTCKPPYIACAIRSTQIHENETLMAWQDSTLKRGTVVTVIEQDPDNLNAVFIMEYGKGNLRGYVDAQNLRLLTEAELDEL